MRAKLINSRTSDVNKLAGELLAEKLFDEEHGRFHQALRGFCLNTKFNSLKIFEKKVKKLNKELSKRHQIIAT